MGGLAEHPPHPVTPARRLGPRQSMPGYRQLSGNRHALALSVPRPFWAFLLALGPLAPGGGSRAVAFALVGRLEGADRNIGLSSPWRNPKNAQMSRSFLVSG